jgi:tryptophan halogenase
MSAIALSAHFPDRQITVIDPSAIGAIGVGESVTGAIQSFVYYPPHGLSAAEFYRETDATPKLGIWYKNWRGPGDEYLTPIDMPLRYFDHKYYCDIEDYYALTTALGQSICEAQTHGRLMRANRTDYYRRPDGNIGADLSMASCHFDALKFAGWLKANAANRTNIHHVDDVIERFEQDPESGFVTKVITKQGNEIEGDFFLDCTGFHRLLFEKAYSPKWSDLSQYIKVDSAIPSPTPYEEGQEIPVYTTSTAMPHGWMWQVPTQSRLGKGYVYSSKYVSDEDAIDEARAAGLNLPDDPKIIRFEPGKFDTQWQGNVCAIGLAGGFLEPLEATTIHIMYGQIKTLTEVFLPFVRRESAQALSQKFNAMMKSMYSDYMDFLTFHYQTGRTDTEFWRDYQKPESITDENLARREKWRHSFPVREDFATNPTSRVFLATGIMIWLPMLCGLGLLSQEHAQTMIASSKFADKARHNATKYSRVAEYLCQNGLTSSETIQFLRGG